MMNVTIILFILLITFTMCIQAITGFGGPLLAMPVAIVLIGIETARPVLTILAFISALLVAAPCYKYIKWKQLLIMAGVLMVGVIAGNYLIRISEILRPLVIIYGFAVVIIGLRRLFFPNLFKLSKPLQFTALGIGGLMQGLFISGGSFTALYAVEQLKDKNEFRATLSAVWVVTNTYLMISYIFLDVYTPEVLRLSAISILPELIAIYAAHKIAERISKAAFLKMTYITLTLSGAVLLINYI